MGARLAIVPGAVKPEVPLADSGPGWWKAWGPAHAQSIGITLVAENIDYPPVQPLMGRGADCAAIARRIDSPAFRLIFDSAAPLFVHEAPLQALSEMAPYLAHVHLKNARPLEPGEPAGRYLDSTRGRRFQGTSLREGVVDLSPCWPSSNAWITTAACPSSTREKPTPARSCARTSPTCGACSGRFAPGPRRCPPGARASRPHKPPAASPIFSTRMDRQRRLGSAWAGPMRFPPAGWPAAASRGN